MRDTVSIIFASIFMVLVVIILPLFSILDRQDNIAYNVVLTQTTKFVDEIRSNGFVTEADYQKFISSLASTGNVYKVTLEAYKHTLIQDTEPDGTVVPDSYIDELELHNTQDIADYLTGNKVNVEAENSNRKENVYLFEKSDEIYVKVYNTNITAGSIMYNMIMGAVDTKVIDITYGGVVNNINWDLYNKIKAQTIATPEITLSVPVNAKNNINVVKFVTDEQLKSVDCVVEDYGGLFADPHEMCSDIGVDDIYKYVYDLDAEDEATHEKINQTIIVEARFTDVTQVQVREPSVIEHIFGAISEWFDLSSYDTWSNIVSSGILDQNPQSEQEQYIINNYISLKGMTADIDLIPLGVNSVSAFRIVLTNVKLATVGALTENASIAVLAGLGRNDYHELSVGDETVTLELTHKTDVRTTAIIGPYNWKQCLKTKNVAGSQIGTHISIGRALVYRNQDIFFKIQYTGIKDLNPDQVKARIMSALSINRDSGTNYTENLSLAIEYYTPLEMLNLYGIVIEPDTIIVKYRYPNTQVLVGNRYLNLNVDWYPGMENVRSEIFYLDRDTVQPNAPIIEFQGTKGLRKEGNTTVETGWYTSNVKLKVVSNGDSTQSSGVSGRTGSVYSDVYRSTASLTGPQMLAATDTDEEIELKENTVYGDPIIVTIKTEDYAENVRTLLPYEIYIDKVNPSDPVVNIAETPTATGWYAGDVHITVDTSSTARKDAHSGIYKTTFEIEGASAREETTYVGMITLYESGISRVTIRNYDRAGNCSTYMKEFKIDKGEPALVEFENINGLKRNEETEWYYTDVETRITVLYTGSMSQMKPSHYEVWDKEGNNIVAKTAFTEPVKDIRLSGNGIYTVKVYTSTTSGTTATYNWEVKIDENAPKAPKVEVTEGTKGVLEDGGEEVETGWYTSDVQLSVVVEGDEGDSNVTGFDYTTQLDGGEIIEVKNKPLASVITISDEGTTVLVIKVTDIAGNVTTYEEIIKIDKTPPKPAKIYIDALQEDGNTWYYSELHITHGEEEDDISGISKIVIKQYTGSNAAGWTEDSEGVWDVLETTKSRKIELITYNGAGLSAKQEQIIKMDNKAPTKPVLTPSVAAGTRWHNEPGIYMAGNQVTVTITPGTETVDGGKESGFKETYYRVVDNDTGSVVLEAVGQNTVSLNVNAGEDKFYTVIGGAKDNAGNISEESLVVRICKAKPPTPSIVNINGKSADSTVIVGTSSSASLEIMNTNGEKIHVYVAGRLVNTINNDGVTYVSSVNVGTTFAAGVETQIYITQVSLFGIESDPSNVVTYKYDSGGGS